MISLSKHLASLCGAALIAFNLASCGGSGGGSTDPGDFLPVGTTLKLIMNDGTNVGHPYIMTLQVTGNNLATATWESKSTIQYGEIAFTYYRENDEQAMFRTSFVYEEGTYIRPGPKVWTTQNAAEVSCTIQLPANLSSQNFARGFSGDCAYHIRIEAASDSVSEVTGTYNGSGGKYKVEASR